MTRRDLQMAAVEADRANKGIIFASAVKGCFSRGPDVRELIGQSC